MNLLRRNTPGLLVSVRNAAEARAALAGGAELIDVKEPSRGPLGKADDDCIAAIAAEVNGRRPVSAAMGELLDWDATLPEIVPGVRFVKFGLAGCRGAPKWGQRLTRIMQHVERTRGCRLVVTSYADWRRADAPPPRNIIDFSLEHRPAALLFDTWSKDGTTLLDWIGARQIIGFARQLNEKNVPTALAGSLGPRQIRELLKASPDWFAVRGSVCSRGNREAIVQARRVRQLVQLLRMHQPAEVIP